MGISIPAFVLLLAAAASARTLNKYYCRSGRDVMVHLFEWKWTDIQKECTWLAEKGYCGVQVSPPMEHRIITSPAYPWYQRYQPVSYKMTSRSGNEAQFKAMVTACNNLGVYIYVDGVINHMTGGGTGTGSAGSSWSGDAQSYPGVPFGSNDFHGSTECKTSNLEIQNYQDPNQVRNCRLVGLRDLKGASTYVRQKVADYMNTLISWGVAGFRIDAAKHMWPADIAAVLDKLNNLNTQWFPANTPPYVYQEVIDLGGEPIKATEYTHMGRVCEFKYGRDLGNVVRKWNNQRLAYLKNFGEGWGHVSGLSALSFVDNHDNQRGHGAGGASILTFWEPAKYKLANAFALAYPYGHVRVMSSYYWTRNIQNGQDQNDWIGPPSNSGGATKDVVCFNGEWVCEHRWREIYNMVRFHNTALGQSVSNWWDNGFNAVAFGRGNKAFIVLNNEDYTLNQRLQTGLPAGDYCDVVTCDTNKPPCGNSGGKCRASIKVDSTGFATFSVPNGDNSFFAIHV
jgi:alpha-amylase